MNLDT